MNLYRFLNALFLTLNPDGATVDRHLRVHRASCTHCIAVSLRNVTSQALAHALLICLVLIRVKFQHRFIIPSEQVAYDEISSCQGLFSNQTDRIVSM